MSGPIVIFAKGGDVTVEIAGVVAGVALLLLARWLLPREEKRRVRQPLVFLGLSIAVAAASWILDAGGVAELLLRFVHRFLLLASLGRTVVLLAIDVVFGRRTHRAPPRIFRDVTQAVVYIVVLLLTLHAVGVEPGSLLTTSALLTAVIGLSLQDTLGNMVSGLALQMQRPFEVGDWIQFEPDQKQVGKVTEVNWRATTVTTIDLDEVIVPNALLAKGPIRNYSRPSPVSRRAIVVQGPYETAPGRVHEAILSALARTPGVLADPAPEVQTRRFGESGIDYAVLYYTKDYAIRDKIDSLVSDRVWYALQRASIGVPFPTRTIHMHATSAETEQLAHERALERRDQVLRCVDFLDVLPREVHRALAAAAQVRLYAAGEVIVGQGEPSQEMFVIERGEVVVELVRETRAVPVANLGPRKFFGEMGLMTGEERAASVRAVTECELLVIGHEAFHAALASQPGVVEKMSDLLATRQAQLEAVASSRSTLVDPVQDRSKRLISQIKDFFKV
jgi:small-conductance mechanosensitive channel/CRP-like cAMP-binding protein